MGFGLSNARQKGKKNRKRTIKRDSHKMLLRAVVLSGSALPKEEAQTNKIIKYLEGRGNEIYDENALKGFHSI